MLEGLQAILEKEVVLPTVNADDLMNTPSAAESDYQKHVATFIPMGDVSEFAQRFAERTADGRTPKGMIIAPYGYGKTSTLAFIWHECERQDLVATPPFYCATLLDILNATYGWVKYRLETAQPDLVEDLDKVYEKYTDVTIEEMAERYAKDQGIAHVTAVNMLTEMMEEGSLVLRLTPSHLLFFLDAASAIVTRAGYKGLVVLPDEFQQYFSKEANLRRIVQQFREFVWGLDTRSNQVGVVFSIPTYAESVIQEQGKDILHRLKKDNLYYRLQDIYTQDFPARLWERHAETFELDQELDQIMGKYTLRSIGQIAEREDLGEGPRTVIDSFKRAIVCFQDRHQAYTPINLIDDFLQANIRFQAQANKLKTITRQTLDSAAVGTSEKAEAVKLMAAFPRGCPIQVQKEYGVYEAINALSKEGHGELMTHLAEGYTLLGLRPTEGPVQLVDRIITRFWRGYEEDELHLEGAIRAFTNQLLPRFFKVRRGSAATGWGSLDFTLSGEGSHVALIEGTFTPRFPRRRLGLQVAYDIAQIIPLLQGADFQFDFLFGLGDHEDSGKLTHVSDRVIRFHLNLRQKVGPAMPDDIRKLQDFVNPEFVTPLLMLSLVDYFHRWGEIEEEPIPETDRAEIEHLSGRLVTHSVQLLLNQTLAQSLDPPLRRVGGRMLEELFSRRCKELFPDYHSLLVHPQYESVLNDYINAMAGMSLKERRGHAPVGARKEALARRFGIGSVATFENRAKNEYADIVEIQEWKGRGDEGVAKIVLKLHPLEATILDAVRSSSGQYQLDDNKVPAVSSTKVAGLAGELGYRDEETLLALQLLAQRGYTRIDRSKKLVYLAQVGPSRAELRNRLNKLVEDLDRVSSDLLEQQRLEALRSSLAEIRDRFEPLPEDEEELDELQTRIIDLEQDLSDALMERREELRRQLNTLINEVQRTAISLRQSNVLDRKIEAQVGFVQHLNEFRQDLAKDRRKWADAYEELSRDLDAAMSQGNGSPIHEVLALHQALEEGRVEREELDDEREVFVKQVDNLQKWIKLLEKADRLFNALDRVPDLRDELARQVVPEIQAHLTKRKLKGLADWEPFEDKVEAVEEELEDRRRHGNERFGEVKETYEQFLRKIEVADYRPRTRYTYGEDQGSYRDLYQEVQEKIEGRLDEIAGDLRQNQTDLLKARYIHVLDDESSDVIEHAEELVERAEIKLADLRRALNRSLVKSGGDESEDYGQQVNELATAMHDVRKELGPVLFADHDLTDEELRILDAFDNSDQIDLTDLFVALHRGGEELELDELLSKLETLYRKNRVIIHVRRRG